MLYKLEKLLNVKMDDLNSLPYNNFFRNKVVLLRVDFNVQVVDGEIKDETRILAPLETVEILIKSGAKVLLLSHFLDPKKEDLEDEEKRENFSLKKIFLRVKEIFQNKFTDINFNFINGFHESSKINESEISLFENVRFFNGEKENNLDLAKKFSDLADVFVNDAFSVSHRNHASVVGIPKFLQSFPGIHFEKEINALKKAFHKLIPPSIAIVGGAKISSKLGILESILQKVDKLIIGGGMVHTFLLAKNISIGNSLSEKGFVKEAEKLLNKYDDKILLPNYLIISKDLFSNETFECNISNGIKDGYSAFDVSIKAVEEWSEVISKAKTIFWNGTLGVAEREPYEKGTKAMAKLIGKNFSSYKLAGGGDTVSAINQLNLQKNFSHISTGGGAFLEWLLKNEVLAEKTLIF